MAKRLSIEYVKLQFEKRGWELLSRVYLNNYTKLDYKCNNGHRHSITWMDFRKGHGCYFCNLEERKLDIEYVRRQFENKKCILKSTGYVNSSTKLDYICPNGHEHSIKWNDFQNGHGCPICAGLNKPEIHDIMIQFENEGCVLTSKEYVNSKTKLYYVCPSGHESSITWNDFQQGVRCPICRKENNFGENTSNWKGGISCTPYCDAWADKEYKESIKVRDGHRCQNPYCFCNCGVLSIHHIDFDKMNCSPSNLITVCNSCNSFANKDRSWHIVWYQTLMNKKYNYTYTQV